jgi:hypothetical protein
MPVGTGTPIIPQAQLDLGPAGWFRPEPENPPGNQLRVKAGFAYRGAFDVLDQFSGGDQLTAGFASVVSGAGFKRYDLVYIDATGNAVILQGNDVAVASPAYNGAPGFNLGPDLPDAAVPVAYVLVDEIGAVTVDVGDVFQINGMFSIARDIFGYLIDKGLFGSPPAGLTDDVSALFAAETPGGNATTRGVVTTPPENFVHLNDQNGDEIKHSTGARMYGRITEAASVWTLSYYYLDAAGAEQTMDPSVNADVAPTDVRLVGVPKAFSKNDPNRPLFDSAVSRLSDQVVGTIPTGTSTVEGKLQIASDGSQTGAAVALGTNDARTGAVRGRANAGAVSTHEDIVRLIAGSGITVGLVQAGGELQFTITSTGSAPGGIDNFAYGAFGAVGVMAVATGWTPRIMFAIQNSGGLNENHSFGVGASTYTTGVPPQNSFHLSVSISVFGAGAGAGADVIPGWSCTVFSNVQVSISGGGINSGWLIAFGGT